MRPRVIRWGMIGCGAVTEVKSGPAFQKARNSTLVAVMRRNAQLARDYASRHGVPKWYGDVQKLIEDPDVDAVYIATPPSSHCEYTVRAAGAGKPVYVEKPMARTHAECQTMIHACEKAGVPLFVAYYRRALPRFRKVRSLLEENAIGRIGFVAVEHYRPPFSQDYDSEQLPWRVRPEISGGGYFMDLASHTFDLLDFLLSPIKDVWGTAVNRAGLYPAEDTIAASWRHACGAVGTGIWCFVAEQKQERVKLVGSQGTIEFSVFENEPIRLLRDGQVREFRIPNPVHIQQPLIQAVVDALNGQGRCPSTGMTAARTNRVMNCILDEFRKEKGISF